MASISLSFSSSLIPSPISLDKCKIHHTPNPLTHSPPLLIRCASAPPSSQTSSSSSSSVAKKRHRKVGEFLGISDTSLPGTQRRTPIKSVKKLDRKVKAKAWVNTATECLADRIAKKNSGFNLLRYLRCLESNPFTNQKKGLTKLIVLLGRCGQPQRVHQLLNTMVEEGCQPTSELYTALLAAYSRNNLFDEAFSTLNEMKNLPLCHLKLVLML